MASKDKEEKGRSMVKVESALEIIAPAEQEAGNKRFEEKVEELLAEEKDLTKKVLYHHWRKGQFAEDLTKNPKKYGAHNLDDLPKRFKVGYSTLTSWHRFYLKYPEENRMKELADGGANWRDINNVLNIASEKQRDDLLKKRITGVISSDQLVEQAAKINRKAKEEEAQERGKPKPKPKAKKAEGDLSDKKAKELLNKVRSANTVLLDSISVMDNFKEAYDDFQKMDESKFKSDIRTSIQDGFKSIGTLHKRLTWVMEYRDRIVAKRKAAAEATRNA